VRYIPAALGEGGGVEDNEVEALPGIPEKLKDILPNHGMRHGGKTVGQQMPARRLVGRLRRIHGNDPGRPAPGGIDGKGAGVGKTVQDRPAPDEGLDLPAVVPLIEEETRLLPALDVHLENEIVFPDGDGRRRFLAPGRFPAVRQALQPPRRAFAPFQNPPGGIDRRQGGDELLPPLFHPGGADGHDQIIPVAIHHQAGDAVPFRIDQATGRIAGGQDSRPEGRRLPEPCPPKIAVHPAICRTAEQPEGNIRPGVIKSQGQGFARRRAGQDDIAGAGTARCLRHRSGKQPRMAAPERSLPPRLQDQFRIFRQKRPLSIIRRSRKSIGHPSPAVKKSPHKLAPNPRTAGLHIYHGRRLRQYFVDSKGGFSYSFSPQGTFINKSRFPERCAWSNFCWRWEWH